jgi:hypothetical protein
MRLLILLFVFLFVFCCSKIVFADSIIDENNSNKSNKYYYLIQDKRKNDEIYQINEMIDKLKNINFHKNEFETTRKFKNRINHELSENNISPNKVLCIKYHLCEDYIKYDIDNKKLNIKNVNCKFHFDDYESFFNGFIRHDGDFYKMNKENYFTHIKDYTFITEFSYGFGLLIDSSCDLVGYYKASNSLGVEAKVRKIKCYEKGVIEMNESNNSDLFSNNSSNIFSIEMSPEKAKGLDKNNLMGLIIYKPTKPYYFQGKDRTKPTIDNPEEIVSFKEYIVGDILSFAIIYHGNIIDIVNTN